MVKHVYKTEKEVKHAPAPTTSSFKIVTGDRDVFESSALGSCVSQGPLEEQKRQNESVFIYSRFVGVAYRLWSS